MPIGNVLRASCFVAAASLTAASLIGCVPPGGLVPQNNVPAQPAKTPTTLNVTDVDFSFQKQTAAKQKQHGVSIMLEPISLGDGQVSHRADVKALPTLIKMAGDSRFEVTYVPEMDQDDRLRFRLKVQNGSKRVLRPSGALITFNVDGKSKSVSGDEHVDFLEMLLPPNASKEVVIAGPKMSELGGPSGLIAIDIYELQVGGELANYSWLINYKKSSNEVASFTEVKTQYLLPEEAALINGKYFDLSKQAQ